MSIPPGVNSRGLSPVVRQETNICRAAGTDADSSIDPKTGLMDIGSDRVQDVFDYATRPITSGTGAKSKTNLIGNGDDTLTKAELQQVIAQSQKELAQAKDPETKAEIRARIGSAAQLLKNFDRFTNKGTGLRFADVQAVRDRCATALTKAPPLPDLGPDTSVKRPFSDWQL